MDYDLLGFGLHNLHQTCNLIQETLIDYVFDYFQFSRADYKHKSDYAIQEN